MSRSTIAILSTLLLAPVSAVHSAEASVAAVPVITPQTVPPALEVSGADHNTLGGWHCVRPALFACGSGQARFRSFSYRPLE